MGLKLIHVSKRDLGTETNLVLFAILLKIQTPLMDTALHLWENPRPNF